jgi:thymidylate synthase
LKHLFTFEEQKESSEEKANQGKVDKIFTAHLKHVLVHYLFLFGANSSIDQIKKAIDPLYVKSDQFM